MAEDDDSTNKSVSYKSYQSHSTGVVPLPPGSRGPRSLYLRKHADSFGFTLRHFIVYPPSTIQETINSRHAAVGVLRSPMDTIFVKHVSPYSAAEQAGLQHGDRIVAVNGVLVNDKTYKQVIQLIQCSPEYLHLLVVPKEDDVLQKFFSETAHNPISNQQIKSERRRLQRPLHQHQQNFTTALQADDLSWKSLLDSTNCSNLTSYKQHQQRSTDNLLYSNPKEIVYDQNLQNIDDPCKRRAQPQVPVYRKMGRRASEGSTFSNKEFYQYDSFATTSVSTRSPDMVVGETKMKSSAKAVYPKSITHSAPRNEMPQSFLYGNTVGCRLSLDGGGRRESSSSIASSIADGSKDSLSSYDSISTLTGLEIDDSIIMSRLRKNLLQKEEFLRRPSHSIEPPTIQREFYGRPKKLEKCTWPPSENNRQESPSRTAKPLHQSFQRVKSDIDTERDLNSQLPSVNYTGGDIYNIPQQNANSLRDWCSVPTSHTIREATPAPSGLECPGEINGALTIEDEDRRLYLTNLQMVSKRTKQFESGRPLPEDDLMLKDRTSFYKSELARLSSKRVVPHVMIRAHEFESRSNEPKHTTSGSCANAMLRRQHRDSRSLDSYGSNASSSSINEVIDNKLSGNVTIPFGSKYIHVPPPVDNKHSKDDPQDCLSQSIRMRDRSNSADSWTVMNSSGEKREGFGEISYNMMERTVNVGEYGVVVRRVKNNSIGDEDRAMRRESYLKATGNGRMQEEELNDREISPQIRSSHRKWRPPIFPGDIQQLRKLFEDATYSLGGSLNGGSISTISLERDKTSMPSSPLKKERQLVKEGLLYCKIASIDGKRAADRSWKQVWVVLKEQKLFLYKDRHHQSPSDAAEQSLASGVDMSTSCVRIAEDYTKRKNVLRVSSILPCRSELLLQMDNNVDLADWIKVLQEKVNTDIDTKSEENVTMKQQAVPQIIPASTSVQVPESSQSPVSKTRKPSQGNEALVTPKTKTWKGRVVKQFRKIQGASSPSSPTTPEGSTFGLPLEHCYPSNLNTHIPRLVEVCTEIVENRGLDVVGVYRVPGNSAAITALTNSVNVNYEGVPQLDAHWNDVHVVSSLLKSFFRKLPDALLTSNLYSNFIEADKIKDPTLRMEEIRKLVCCLPLHHYHTLKHLMLHLKKVTNNCKVNKMEGRNLAIVFGPTLIRAVQDDMATLVNDMTHNYKIVESLISYANWFFSDDRTSSLNLTSTQPIEPLNNELDVASNRALLLDNISKVEGIKGEKVPGRELFSSIISAAHRKMRKGTKVNISSDLKDELNGLKEFTLESNFSTNLEQILPERKSNIPTTIIEIEKSSQTADRGTYFNYSDQENYRRRIKNFIQETEANLQRNRKTTEFYTDNFDLNVSRDLQNLNQATMSHSNIINFNNIAKMQSASNVFYKPVNESTRHSTNSALTMQYAKNPSALDNAQSVSLKSTDKSISFDVNENKEHIVTEDVNYQNFFKKKFCDSNNFVPKLFDKTILRRGSSAETINASIMDLASSGTMKKIKFGNEIDVSQRTSSLDSLYKTPDDDGGDLQSSIMKIFDEKKKTLNPLLGTDLPFADEAPESRGFDIISYKNKGNLSASPKLYRNPSLHKSLLGATKFAKLINVTDFKTKELQKENIEEEKDKDCSENVPDNERHIREKQNVNDFDNKANANFNYHNTNSMLRRSESLNKPERMISLPNNKLKRSESLNKTSDRLKRSDSLSKNEKTENNINKRRELTAAIRRYNKDLPKLKRKNGMPERSIKRRHTVGGTKDFDKVNWLDNRYQEEITNMEKCSNEKCTLRTSSPDLSSMRRERLFFEVNLVGPENMIVALRQHLIGPRPQRLSESRIFNVPLESHV